MAERKPISKRVRFEVFKRDGFACQYCGAHPPDATLEVDHITPVAEGGTNDDWNLVTACFSCNRGKGAVSLDSVPQSLEQKAAMVAEREEQLRGYHDVMEAHRQRAERDMWRIAEAFDPEAGKGHPREFLQSYKRFNEKLGVHAVLDAVDITLANVPYLSPHKRFRYFCGVCWNRIRQQEEIHGSD